jgi:hypothetical protein
MNFPKITIGRKSGKPMFDGRLAKIYKMASYVGIPAEKSSRKRQKVNNAELLFIHTKGSPIRGIPARPVLDPAIAADGNRQAIAHELAESAKAILENNPTQATARLRRAGQAGQNAARAWFTDSRNNWAPNAPSTIRRKGSDKPLIDTGVMLSAITHVEK